MSNNIKLPLFPHVIGPKDGFLTPGNVCGGVLSLELQEDIKYSIQGIQLIVKCLKKLGSILEALIYAFCQ